MDAPLHHIDAVPSPRVLLPQLSRLGAPGAWPKDPDAQKYQLMAQRLQAKPVGRQQAGAENIKNEKLVF